MRITIVGQIQNKKTGLGKAINDLIEAATQSSTIDKVNAIDITNNFKFIMTLYRLLSVDTDIFYLTPAGSLFGNIRDCIILWLMTLRRKPVILHFHNSQYGKTIERHSVLLSINKYLYHKVSAIIILGNKQRKMFTKLNVPEDTFIVIRNGVDKSLFIEEAELTEKWATNTLQVTYFSNMILEKGYMHVLQVAQDLRDDERFHFNFSGKFFEEEPKQRFLGEVSLLENVTYFPGVYGEEKRQFLQRMHVFVLPSSYADETLPISMLEAASAGAYLVVSDVGVISEVIKPKVATLLTENTAEAIKHELLDIWEQRQTLQFDIDYYRSFENQAIQAEILQVMERIYNQ